MEEMYKSKKKKKESPTLAFMRKRREEVYEEIQKAEKRGKED